MVVSAPWLRAGAGQGEGSGSKQWLCSRPSADGARIPHGIWILQVSYGLNFYDYQELILIFILITDFLWDKISVVILSLEIWLA